MKTLFQRSLPLVGMSLFAVAAHMISTLAQRTIYGLDGGVSAMLLADAFSDLIPLPAMFAALLALPKIDRSHLPTEWPRCVKAIALCVSAFFAISAVVATLATGILPSFASLPMSWANLAFDLLLVVTLACGVLTVAKGRWTAIAMMLAYIVAATLIGQFFGIIQFIGFGTTPHQVATQFSPVPLGSQVAWTWRLYWFALLALFLVWLMPAPKGASKARFAGMGASALAAIGLAWAGHSQMSTARAAVPFADTALPEGFDTIETRPKVESLTLNVDASRIGEKSDVEGTLTLLNDTGRPIRRILLEHGVSLKLAKLEGESIGDQWSAKSERLTGITLSSPMMPNHHMSIRFSGEISPQSPATYSRAQQQMEGGLFLPQGALFPLPRTTACALPPLAGMLQCGEGENYLLGDAISGEIRVVLPTGWKLAGADTASADGQFAIHLDPKQRGNFMLVAAPYGVEEFAGTDDCPTLTVYLAASSQETAQKMRDTYCREWTQIAADFDLQPAKSQWIAEVPEHVALGLSLHNGILISERVLEGGPETALVRHVIAHEISHRLWGYIIAPEKLPGHQFVLEALPQYIALTNADAAADPTSKIAQLDAYRREQGGPAEASEQLWTSSNEADFYLSQPRTLLEIDAAHGADRLLVRSALIKAYARLSSQEANQVSPNEILAAIADALPPQQRKELRGSLGAGPSARTSGSKARRLKN